MAKSVQSRLQLHALPQALSVAVVAMVGVGSRYEQSRHNGISHFLEHMVFKGTAKRPTSLDITSEVDGIGGDFNAFTGKEFTGFYIKSAAKDVGLAIDVLSDIMFNAKHEQAEIDRERGVILEEMNMYHDSPRDRVGEMIDHLLYPNQPLGWDIIGTKESLANINHQDIKDYNQRWYAPNNMVVSVVGSFDQPAMESMAASAFFDRPEQNIDSYIPANWEQSKPEIITHQKDTDQTHMVLAVRSFSLSDPRRYALAVLNVILGANMSSRLFTQVRERRGLAYAIHTNTDHNLDCGSLNCQIGLDHSRIQEVIQVVLAEYAQIKSEGVTESELALAKRYMRGRLALSLEDPLGLGMYTARQQLLRGQVETPEQYLQKIDAITVNDIKKVAQEIFVNNGLNLSIIGPKIDQDKIMSTLTF